jgi:hypothetical protein
MAPSFYHRRIREHPCPRGADRMAHMVNRCAGAASTLGPLFTHRMKLADTPKTASSSAQARGRTEDRHHAVGLSGYRTPASRQAQISGWGCRALIRLSVSEIRCELEPPAARATIDATDMRLGGQ